MFGPVVTAMVTPMRADRTVDLEKAGQLARYLVENDSDTVLVCGTTGESPTMTDAEKIDLIRAVKDAVRGGSQVMAGTGTYDTQHTIALSKAAVEAGADSLLLVVPYYNKPPQEGLYQHFSAVASEVPVPCMIYNIPSRTGVNLLPETLARLAQLKNIVAVKEASGSLDQISACCRLTPPGFLVYSGDDSLTLPVMAVGGAGVVSVASHLVGPEIRQMIENYQVGKVGEAVQMHHKLSPLFKALFVTTNPIPVKWALKLVGRDCGPTRPPLSEPTDADKEAIRRALEALELVPTG
jgi:4-hydroxy-tetrahydrodipicolinate synthase